MKNIKQAEHSILENGLKVIYAPDHSNPLVSIQLYILTGSAWESSDEAGFSHFSEHLVFKSHHDYPEGNIIDRIAFLGGSINAYTEYDSTCYYLDISSEYIKEALQVLSDLIIHANFTEKDFLSERKVIFEELKEAENDPEDSFIETVAGLYLTDNPYKNPIIGNRQNLKRATAAELRKFISDHYFPGNSFLVIAGDYQRSELDMWISGFFGDWQNKPRRDRPSQFGGHPQQFKFTTVKHKSQSDVIAVALPDLAENHPDSIALSVLYKAFFMEKNSYLYDELFKKKKLIDNIKVNGISGIHDGVTILLLFPKQGVSPLEVIKGFRDCWHDFRCRGISAVQLMQHTAEILNSFRISREYMESYASNLGSEEIYSDYRNYYSFPGRLKKISRQDIRSCLDKWLDEKHINIFYKGSANVDSSLIYSLFQKKETIRFDQKRVDYLERKFDNGASIIYKKIIGKPTIGIAATIRVSQLYEPPGFRGANYLTGAMLLYGNRLHSYDKFLDFCLMHGIQIRVSPLMDITTIKCKCFQEDLPLALEMLSYVIFQPEFPREHFQNVKNSILSSMHRIKDYPQQQAMMLWRKQIFGSKSNLYNREGKRKDFANLSLSRLKKWHQTFYTPDNLTLVVAGDLNFSSVDEMVNKYFADKISYPAKMPTFNEVYPAINRYKISDRQSSQGVIIIGGYAPGIQDTKRALAMNVLCQILGGDTNSRLFNELREKNGLAYSVEMEYFAGRQTGMYITAAVVDRDNTAIGLKMIKQLFSQIVSEGISNLELTKIKNHIIGEILQEEESVSSIAASISRKIALGLGMENYLTRRQRILAVSKEEVQSVAREFLHKDNFFIQILK
jgi:zinc protease